MFQPETVSFRGHFSMANMPDYSLFKFFDIPREPRRPKEVKRTSLEFAEEKEAVVRRVTGSKYLLAMENLIHERSHPDVLEDSEGETERKKIYFKKYTVDAFLPEMVAFFQYNNSNFMKEVYEDGQVNRRDDFLIFGEDDLGRCRELSNREMADSISSQQNESISEEEQIKEQVYEKLVGETKEISEDFDHSEAKAVNQPRPVIELESSTDDKRESIPEADQHQFSETESNFKAEERIEEIKKSHVDQRQCSPEESSAIVPETCSCQREGKEPLQHCCNGSTRSTISNGSSRSFSFPIFSSELTGSPVRIPDSEWRKLRLHRRRRGGIFCCKF